MVLVTASSRSIVLLTSGSTLWIASMSGLGTTCARRVRRSVETSIACAATSATGITVPGADAGVCCDSALCWAATVPGTTPRSSRNTVVIPPAIAHVLRIMAHPQIGKAI
jgi:hypothetical protein